MQADSCVVGQTDEINRYNDGLAHLMPDGYGRQTQSSKGKQQHQAWRYPLHTSHTTEALHAAKLTIRVHSAGLYGAL